MSGFRFRAFPIPSTFSGPRGITPAFEYGAPHSGTRGTLTLLSNALLSAHYEYVRLGTVSLLAGLDLHNGRITEIVSDTHNSADFITFLKKLDAAYAPHQRIRLVLDNHSAHISKETRNYLESLPQRFLFVFTPTHGSWLNLIESQFSKMTRTMLRGIRVATKQELVDRIHQYFEEINSAPVVFRWKYKMDETVIV